MSAPRILLLGSGGREHAMARALRTTAGIDLLVAPGNPGLCELASAVRLDLDDPEAIARRAAELGVDLVLPGPESILCAGIADALRPLGIACCGPSALAARLEASKSFMRELTAPLGVPGPRYIILREAAHLAAALRECATWARSRDGVPVVKADGLAGGKGVFLPATLDECAETAARLLERRRGSGGPVLLEERLCGPEASLFYACCGEDCVAMPSARDHKRLRDGDQGPNTGGMGALSPNPDVTAALIEEVRQRIVQPTLRALCERGTPFIGFLFVGLMLTAKGPALLEFNVRLGDPEAQVILPQLADGEFLRLCLAMAHGGLKGHRIALSPRPTCAVALCAAGYPDTPRSGDVISIDPELLSDDVWVIHAGTRADQSVLRSAGGRVLSVVARGDTAAAARERAYRAIAGVHFAGMHYRTDIGI